MGAKVCKFGGTSLADAAQMRKVDAIVRSDPDRRYVVPSAPGKRNPSDQKITDILYRCRAHAQQGIAFDEVFRIVEDRFLQIVMDLGLDLDLRPHLEKIKTDIGNGGQIENPTEGASPSPGGGDQAGAYAASRGEFLNGLVVAELLGFTFVDAAECIRFQADGSLDAETTESMIAQHLSGVDRAVIPGFYGSLPDGRLQTFTRGGSDISGSLVAAAVHADVYENWTDVPGLLMADPRIVADPKVIDVVTYRELRELAYMGATVLHDEAIFPVRKANINVNIRSTNEPEASGSMIIPDAAPIANMGNISGIAGRKDFTVIAVEKALMNAELGFGWRLLGVLEGLGISYEHTPTGIDTMSVVVADAQLEGKRDLVLQEIQRTCSPDSIDLYPHMALIATVGRGMAHFPGSAAKLFGALGESGINIRMIDQGSSELNIIVGVEAADFERALCAIYAAFVN